MLLSRPFIVCVLCLSALALNSPSNAVAETWTSLQGTHSVEARMVGLWDDKVVLQLQNGRRVAVPLMSLRSESRIQAQEIARRLDSARAERVAELQGRATAAAAPAPNPLPTPPAADAYVPPKANVTASQFLQQLDDAIAAGHIKAVYDALPPSYRADIDSIVKLATQQIRPSTWQSIVGTAHQAGDLFVTRQNWIFSSPRLDALDEDQMDQLRGPVLAFANVLRVGLEPSATQVDRLQAIPFSEWLAERDKAVAPYLAQMFRYSDTFGRTISVDSERDGVATVSLKQGSTTTKVQFVSVEGYWVPKTLADTWSSRVDSWKAEVNGGGVDTMAALIQGTAGTLMQTLASASDANQFHTAMDPILPIAQGAIASISSSMGRGGTLASTSGPGGGNRGFQGGYEDEGYDDLYDEEMGDGYESEMEEGYGVSGSGSGGRGSGRGSSGPGAGPSGFGSAPASNQGGSQSGSSYGSGSSGPPSGAGSGDPQQSGYGSGGSGPPSGAGSSDPQESGYGSSGSGPPRGSGSGQESGYGSGSSRR
ncbi:MAG: SHD1 domain-containing protein [Planctomycetota bacterium]